MKEEEQKKDETGSNSLYLLELMQKKARLQRYL